MSTFRRSILALLLLTAAACSARQTEPMVGREPTGLQILVENGTSASLRVYALLRGNELLLGRVDPLQQRSLRLPVGVSGSMQLMARDGVRGRGHVSTPFTLTTGQRMTWRLQLSPGSSDAANLSSVHIFNCDDEADC